MFIIIFGYTFKVISCKRILNSVGELNQLIMETVFCLENGECVNNVRNISDSKLNE